MSNTETIDDRIDNHTDNRVMVNQIQRFTASSISILSLVQSACDKLKNEELHPKDLKSKEKFMDSSQKFVENMKNQDNFDYTRFIKKAFNSLKSVEQCERLREKDPEIFNVRDEDNRIITILPGIDLKYAYKVLDDNEKILFWQYMYLISNSVFNLVRLSNIQKFNKYAHIIDTIQYLEREMGKTGIMFNDQIFNPFIGIGENQNEYGVDEMFTGGELPKQQSISIESVLNMLGINKMFDEKKLNEELKCIGDQQINEATDKITSLLGAANQPEVKEVCNILIQDIVANFRENGIGNLNETLQKVAANAKKNIELSKMKKTAESMKYFMANSQEKLKDLKDADGNPIGQQLFDKIAVPMNMFNMMSGGASQGSHKMDANNDTETNGRSEHHDVKKKVVRSNRNK